MAVLPSVRAIFVTSTRLRLMLLAHGSCHRILTVIFRQSFVSRIQRAPFELCRLNRSRKNNKIVLVRSDFVRTTFGILGRDFGSQDDILEKILFLRMTFLRLGQGVMLGQVCFPREKLKIWASSLGQHFCCPRFPQGKFRGNKCRSRICIIFIAQT